MTKSYNEARAWAVTAEVGDYLAKYADDDLDDVSDPGSRCGYDDETLSAIEAELGKRDLKLEANDRGLVVVATKPREVTIDAARYADYDDCLAAAAAEYVEDHPNAAGYDLSPRWADDDRDQIVLTVPS